MNFNIFQRLKLVDGTLQQASSLSTARPFFRRAVGISRTVSRAGRRLATAVALRKGATEHRRGQGRRGGG